MNEKVRYHEVAVPQSLQRHVQCAWRLWGKPDPGHIDTIYPDGRCELIVHLQQPPDVFTLKGGWKTQATCMFAAQHRSAILLSPRGEIDCIGIRLQPAASACAVMQSLAKLRDQIIDLAQIDLPFARDFLSIVRANRVNPFTQPLWSLLEVRLSGFTVNPGIEQAVRSIIEVDGYCRIKPLAENAAMSLRTFQARFLESVGLGFKEFARIIRLQATLRLLDQNSQSLTDIAIHSGYSDQAHASREVHRITGLTPSRLREALKSDRTGEQTIRMAAAFVRGRSK